jgi:four helix bundle protein
MRRAAISVTNNIAEGHGRWHYVENRRYCPMSRGSVEEAIDDLNVCLDEQYAPVDVVDPLKTEALDLIKRINSYIAYLNKTKQGEDQ